MNAVLILNYMYFDKSIESMKIKTINKSAEEINQIEKASISHIRSISSELQTLLNEISDMEPSMFTPNTSPINRKYNSGPSLKSQSQDEQLNALSFLKKQAQYTNRESIKIQTHRKGSSSSVHFSSYMKPIHHLKEKIRQIIEEQKRQKQIEEQRQRKQIQIMKKNSIKNYVGLQPRFNKYDDKKTKKAEAVANRKLQKSFQQMSGVTFMPKINNNVQINQSFDSRLITNKHKQLKKEGQIIKDMLKNQTHKPKINSHKQSESKIKKIWCQSSIITAKSSRVLDQNQQNLSSVKTLMNSLQKNIKSNQIKTNVGQLQFMIKKELFEK